MLVYSPVFDPYHCAFRAIRLLRKSPVPELEIERWRILDFYLVFPALIRDFTFPDEYKHLRKLVPKEDGKYRKVTDPKRIFFRMEPIQTAAVSFLVSHKVISNAALVDSRKVRWVEEACPEPLRSMTDDLNDDPILEILVGAFMTIDLYGKSGLKARSDLFQYRYDVPGSK